MFLITVEVIIFYNFSVRKECRNKNILAECSMLQEDVSIQKKKKKTKS